MVWERKEFRNSAKYYNEFYFKIKTGYKELSRGQIVIAGEYVELSRSTAKMILTILRTT
jgi:hypothetical protein